MTFDNTWWCFLMMNRHTDNANSRVPLRHKSEILWRIIWEISCVMFGDKNWSRTCWLRHHLIRCFIFILKAASTAQAGSNKTTFPRVGGGGPDWCWRQWEWDWCCCCHIPQQIGHKLLWPHTHTHTHWPFCTTALFTAGTKSLRDVSINNLKNGETRSCNFFRKRFTLVLICKTQRSIPWIWTSTVDNYMTKAQRRKYLQFTLERTFNENLKESIYWNWMIFLKTVVWLYFRWFIINK